MKIARTSRLNALVPGLILALLLITAGTIKTVRTGATLPGLVPTAAAQEAVKAAAQELALEGTWTDVMATTTARGKSVLAGTFTEFALSKESHPQLMAMAQDGSIYYAQAGINKIGYIPSPSSADSGKLTVRDFAIPTANSYPEGIVVAPDGNVWFTEQNGHKVAKLDPTASVITEYPTPTANSGPVGITVGPDNNIWFTEAYANKIGMFDPNNPEKMEEYDIPTPVSAPLYITTGPDGGLWFVGVRGHKLARIDPGTHAIVEYPTLTAKAGPVSVIVGPDNALWVSEIYVDKIARFDVKAARFTDEVPIASKKNGARSGPGILVNSPDGNIWFTEMFGNQIARLNPKTKEIQEFSAPAAPTFSAASAAEGDTAKEALVEARIALKAGETLGPTGGPGGILFSHDGAVWYTAIFANRVSHLRVK